MNRQWLWTLAVGALITSAFGTAHAASTTVMEQGIRFVEAQVDVTVGDSVTWVYQSSPANSGHTVTFEDPTLNTDGRFANCPGTLLADDCQRSSSQPVVRSFNRVGTFPYYCKVHRTQGMTGVVVVGPKVTTTTTASSTTSSTLPRATTTSSTAKASTSSTTATTRALATSSTLASSSTTSTTADTSSVLLPGDPPPFSGEDANSAAGKSGGSDDDGSDSGTVALIVAGLLAVAGGGGYLLWRLRPGRT